MDFKQVAKLVEEGAHLTKEGSLPAAQEGEIKLIKARMNRGRIN